MPEDTSNVREIILVQRPEPKASSRLDRAEQLSKIIAAVGIPVVLALAGYKFQAFQKDKGLQQEYVKLAVSVLQNKDTKENLRAWAVDILNANSPIPLPSTVSTDLRSGETRLPYQGASSVEVLPHLNLPVGDIPPVLRDQLFIGAGRDGNLQKLQTLLAAGANVNAQTENGWTALMFAAEQDHADAVQWLLGSGADPMVRTSGGHTALEFAKSQRVRDSLKKAGGAPGTATATSQ